MKVLLTGGAGYIGTHTAVALAARGHEPVVLDDFSNSSPVAVSRVSEITGMTIPVVEGDAADFDLVLSVLREHAVDAVIHFAGLKAVGESVANPLEYYRVNLGTALSTLQAMVAAGVQRLVFSSSATVYENPAANLHESAAVGLGLENPYGRSKVMIESIIRDTAAASPEFSAATLRYFNPIGAHPSGLIGEDPRGVPNNLLPYIAQVATGRRDRLRVFGDDYPTKDGTGVRDYIHVMDLAEGHVAALEAAEPGVLTLNLGSGVGSSVFEVLRAFEAVVGQPIPYEVVARRPGDAAETVADPGEAIARLGWRTRRSLEEAVRDTWNWQRRNPDGYSA